MCSKTRGPASEPSLVTCPTINNAVPLFLAKRVSRAADSRICDTPPGADCKVSVYKVWIESKMATDGRSCAKVSQMRSTQVSAMTCNLSVGKSKRLARKAT